MSRGFTVAIVGADGSGKSTIAEMILSDSRVPMKYIYMGASTDASNVSLPTSRLLAYLKRRRIAKSGDKSDSLPPAVLMSEEMKARLPRGRIVKALGLVNRIAEEWYRQLVVWINLLSGYIVICDRHFLFDYFPDSESLRSENDRASSRLHAYMLSRFFPRPNLTLFLDAPSEVLYARKPEWTVGHLDRQRTGIAEQGRYCRNFVVIDATQPVSKVFSDVHGHIDRFRAARSRRGG